MKNTERTIVAILHDIRSLHNVGSMFRTADAAKVGHIYLSGYTPSPVDRFGRKRKEIAKTALGAERTVPWSVEGDLPKLLSDLRKKGCQIVALESGCEKGVPYDEIDYGDDVALIVGNEVDGIPPEILAQADVISEIPLLGEKESLNVSVAFGVGLYGIRRATRS